MSAGGVVDTSGERRKSKVIAAGLVRTARPKQWAKNLLVAAAPGAAGVLTDGDVLGSVVLAVVAFCFVSSGTYFINDALDLDRDRLHPLKRTRPVAAGIVSQRLAVGVGIGLTLAGAGLALMVNVGTLAIVVLYVTLTTSYSLGLKDIEVIDIATVASGFIIRAVAGGIAAGVPLSPWFLIVTSFGSLFIVAGKRHGEHIDLGPEAGTVRVTLSTYPRSYLQYMWAMSSGITITAYCLWAFERSESSDLPLFELSVVPFVLFILRYALLLERGGGATPEDVVLGDRVLLVLAVLWVAVFGLGVQLSS